MNSVVYMIKSTHFLSLWFWFFAMEKLQTILEGPVKQLQNQGYILDRHNGAKKFRKRKRGG